MKEKYIREKFGLFYDKAGSFFYRFNSREEKEVDVSSLEEETALEIAKEHNFLLEEIIRLTDCCEANTHYEAPFVCICDECGKECNISNN